MAAIVGWQQRASCLSALTNERLFCERFSFRFGRKWRRSAPSVIQFNVCSVHFQDNLIAIPLIRSTYHAHRQPTVNKSTYWIYSDSKQLASLTNLHLVLTMEIRITITHNTHGCTLHNAHASRYRPKSFDEFTQ